MAFKILINGKEAKQTKIDWKFKTLDEVYSSEPERLDRNIAFWRNKHKVGADVEIEILNPGAEIEVTKTITSEEYANANSTNMQSTTESIDESNSSESIEEPVVSQDLTDTVNPPVKKPRKKTTKL
jgi:hypothetical protein